MSKLAYLVLALLAVPVLLVAGTAKAKAMAKSGIDDTDTEKMVERFLEYVTYDTTSDDASGTKPSTPGQRIFAEKLASHLQEIGISDVTVDVNGCVTAALPANTDKKVSTIGFISHIDTSPDMSGANANPRIVKNYDGRPIVLNEKGKIVLSPDEFPELKAYKGENIIVTDGNTLLGADDKAGICEIFAAMEYLISHPEIKHGTIKIAFTPDEEIGRSGDQLDVKKFGADFAYTVDGGEIGGLEYETFNAASATVVVKGRNVHPGAAKNKMINALLIAMEYNSLLPADEIPARTEGYQGFYHLNSMSGNVEQATLHYIIRDHDRSLFEAKKQQLKKIAADLNTKYAPGEITVALKDQYYNMCEKIKPVFHIVDIAETAMKEVGVEPKISPVRGGTDGAKLSFMGLPTPNIFTGGHNYHGRYEYVPIGSMKKAAEVIIKIAEVNAR